MEWINVEDRLPVVPEEKYGITVLVAIFNSVYEEINPGHGYEITTMSFWNDVFYSLVIGGEEGSCWIPSPNLVTHWMPMPEPPNE